MSNAVNNFSQNLIAANPVKEKKRYSGKAKKITVNTILFSLCIFFAFVCLFPILLLMVNATRTTVQIRSGITFIPSTHLVENLRAIIDKGWPLTTGYLNSIIIAVATTFLSVYFSALTTYGFQMYNFKGKKFFYSIVLAIILIPGQLGMIGWFQLITDIGLIDSFIPLIVPSIAAAGTVFFLRQYMQANFGEDIVQAARIDGANEIYTFHIICMPLIMPALATMAIFTFINTWNNYQGPLLILNSENKFTLPMLLERLKGSIYQVDQGAQTAGVFMSLMPLLIMYLIFSKPIVSGVALGGVKE